MKHSMIPIKNKKKNLEGIVEEVLYAKKHAADHFSFNKVKEFSLS